MSKAVLRVPVGGGGAKKPSPPPSAALPLYKPKDTVVVKLEDKRKINPATGRPFNVMGAKGIPANEDDIKAIIAHAKAKGIDPRTALAIALQETNIGRENPNYGSAWATFEDEGLPDDRNKNANILAKAIKEKMAYATELRRKGVIPEGEEYDLQTYNGLGLLKTQLSGTGQPINTSYYGIPVTAQQPLDLKRNPAYGKIVKQLRDEVIGVNPRISELIESTPAYGGQQTAPPAAKKVVVRVKK